MWLCQCDCGKKVRVAGHDLLHGTQSCGCLAKEVRLKNLAKGWGWNKKPTKEPKAKTKQIRTGESGTRLYKIWDAMKRRCYNSKHIYFKNYGGRGIKICDEWLNDFYAFKKWSLSNGYEATLTIDRINNNGNYEPSNCRWVTNKENCNNTRTNRLITINGITKTLQQWADECGIYSGTIRERLRRGWSDEKLLEEPKRKSM